MEIFFLAGRASVLDLTNLGRVGGTVINEQIQSRVGWDAFPKYFHLH